MENFKRILRKISEMIIAGLVVKLILGALE